MDMPPPIETSQPAQVEFFELSDPAEVYKIHILARIDSDDIPENVKKFANDNNCISIMKHYHWSNIKYAGGDVYSCTQNCNLKYILVKNNKMRFAHWWQIRKLNGPIYE